MGAIASLRKPRVLIVEDDTLAAMRIVDVLQGMGCEAVGPATLVVTALPMALHEQLDAGLLDVYLIGQTVGPVADVLERRGIPFAFVTAYARNHLPAAHRVRPYVSKPFTDHELQTAVEALVVKE